MVGELEEFKKKFYRTGEFIKPISITRSLVYNPFQQESFNISVALNPNLTFAPELLVGYIGFGRKVYDLTDVATWKKDAHTTKPTNGIEDHLAQVEKLKQQGFPLLKREFYFGESCSKQLETDNDIVIRQDIVMTRGRKVFLVSSALVPDFNYYYDLLITRPSDEAQLFSSTIRDIEEYHDLVKKLERGDYSFMRSKALN